MFGASAFVAARAPETLPKVSTFIVPTFGFTGPSVSKLSQPCKAQSFLAKTAILIPGTFFAACPGLYEWTIGQPAYFLLTGGNSNLGNIGMADKVSDEYTFQFAGFTTANSTVTAMKFRVGRASTSIRRHSRFSCGGDHSRDVRTDPRRSKGRAPESVEPKQPPWGCEPEIVEPKQPPCGRGSETIGPNRRAVDACLGLESSASRFTARVLHAADAGLRDDGAVRRVKASCVRRGGSTDERAPKRRRVLQFFEGAPRGSASSPSPPPRSP
jgi:hypothetical protein